MPVVLTPPSTPTLSTIVVEGLKKAGYRNPTTNESALVTRAQDEWMEEIKNEIWALAKKLTSLQTQACVITTKGRSKYSYPTDFSSLISMTILEGTITGACQSGSTTSAFKLAASDSHAEADLQGKEILITAGTAVGMISQITAYDSSTKIATVSPSVDTAPVSGDTYLIIDEETEVTENPVWRVDTYSTTPSMDKPSQFYPLGDQDDGEFYLRQTPDAVYGVKIKYYADLMELDLSGTLMATLYKKWRNIFTYGIYVRGLQHQGDSDFAGNLRVYGSLLQALITRETYGMDLSNIQIRMTE